MLLVKDLFYRQKTIYFVNYQQEKIRKEFIRVRTKCIHLILLEVYLKLKNNLHKKLKINLKLNLFKELNLIILWKLVVFLMGNGMGISILMELGINQKKKDLFLIDPKDYSTCFLLILFGGKTCYTKYGETITHQTIKSSNYNRSKETTENCDRNTRKIIDGLFSFTIYYKRLSSFKYGKSC